MSKALRIAQDCIKNNRVRRDLKEVLTPQKERLYVSVMMAYQESPDEYSAKLKHFEGVAERLDAGGIIDLPIIERMKFRQTATYQRQQAIEQERKAKFSLQQPGVDDIAAAHVCHQSEYELSECCVRDLFACKGAPAKGRFVRVTTVEAPFKISSIQCCVEDKRGTAITFSVYNMVGMYDIQSKVDLLFPIGAMITIKEPYLKCSNQGYLMLRVDNPCNITVTPPPAISFKSPSPTPDSLKADGNASFKAKEYADAVDFYSKGLDAVHEIRKTLLSNRAVSHLKLCKYALAKVDCDDVLAMDPTHGKALLRREEALRGMSATTSDETTPTTDVNTPMMKTSVSEYLVEGVDALRVEGNDHFKKGGFAAAVNFYSMGLAAAQQLTIALLSNRAASYLHLLNSKAALADCDAVLVLEPCHAKATARRKQAADLVRRSDEQKQGKYDFLTLPFAPPLQQHVENYFGPIEIPSAGLKGEVYL